MSGTFLGRAVNRFYGMFGGKRTQKVFSTGANVASMSNPNRPVASTDFVDAGHCRPVSFFSSRGVADYTRYRPRLTQGTGRIFEAVRGMSTISCVPKPCAAPLTTTDARQYFRQPLIAKNESFGTVSGTRTQKVFSTSANVGSKSNPNRPAASTDFVDADHCPPVPFVSSGVVVDYEWHERVHVNKKTGVCKEFTSEDNESSCLRILKFINRYTNINIYKRTADGRLIKINRAPPIKHSVAINGFDQVARCLLRQAVEDNVNVVAINAFSFNLQSMRDMLLNDLLHTKSPGEVEIEGDKLRYNDKLIKVCHVKYPLNISWRQLQAEYVIDTTENCTDRKTALNHLLCGAKKVLVTNPINDVPSIIKGVNYREYHKTMSVVSTATNVANCVLPLQNIMMENFNMKSCSTKLLGTMWPSKKIQNLSNHWIIYATERKDFMNTSRTESYKDVNMDVFYLKLNFNLCSKTNLTDIKLLINQEVKKHDSVITSVKNPTESDILNFGKIRHSAIVDINRISVVNDTSVTIGAWYNRTTGFASRTLDLVKHMMAVDHKK